MWRHIAPHDAPRPWQRRATVDRVCFNDGQQQVVLTLFGGAWHGWPKCKSRLGCYDDQMLCARHWAGGCRLMHGQMLTD